MIVVCIVLYILGALMVILVYTGPTENPGSGLGYIFLAILATFWPIVVTRGLTERLIEVEENE